MRWTDARVRSGAVARAVTLLAALAAGGCLLTGTKVFTHALGDIQIQGAFFASGTADLTENAVYREHRDDIRHLDEVGFTTRVVNDTVADATVSIRFSDDPDLGGPVDIRNDTFPLLTDIRVPAGETRVIGYGESVERLQSFDRLREMVEAGSVTIYAVSDGFFDLALLDFTLVVTFTVGL